LVRDLLAKGLVFNFADKFYYENQNKSFDKFSDDKLLNEFKNYLISSNYNYQSLADKKLDEVVKLISDEDNTKKIEPTIKKLKEQIGDLFNSEYEKSKQEIVGELRGELALRFSGAESEIREWLKYDKQFKAAMNVLNNAKIYNRLLSSKL